MTHDEDDNYDEDVDDDEDNDDNDNNDDNDKNDEDDDDDDNIVVDLGTRHDTVGTHDPVWELLPYPGTHRLYR